MFLEEKERQFNDVLDSKFNFIREFARYGIGDYPVLYFNRKFPVLLNIPEHLKNPSLLFKNSPRMNYLYADAFFYEFEFFGHVFAVATSKIWDIGFENYYINTVKTKSTYFYPPIFIKKFNDIDLVLNAIGD
jgi:hypothetical protein